MNQPVIGEDFAGYQVQDLLGRGGMGSVYLVHNPHLERQEALKVLSMDAAGDFGRRFSLEARTAASLDHPHIVTIYHHGIDDGTPWFTMQYLAGHDLTDAGPMPVGEALAVLERVAAALDYAHSRGVIHRDVKPGNIQVHRDDSGRLDRVTVLDFGIARLAGATSLTAAGSFIGTLAYSAPETIEGHEPTGAADQYSLAATAYQLLTGTQIFSGSPAALIKAQTTDAPPPPSRQAPQLAPFDPVIARALAKRPEQRYPSCAAFVSALRGAIGRPGSGALPAQTPAGPPSAPRTAVPPVSRPITAPPPTASTPPSRPPMPPVTGPGRTPSADNRTTILLAVLAAIIAAMVIGGAIALATRDSGRHDDGAPQPVVPVLDTAALAAG